MKILWFCNNPCGSQRRNGGRLIFGGWLVSLEDIIKRLNNIELCVCYITKKEEKDFIYDNVHYYPVVRNVPSNALYRIIDRYRPITKKDQKVLTQLIEVIEKACPDLIHIHGTEDCFGLIQPYIKNIPIVFSIQGLLTSCSTKFYTGYPKSFIRKKESISNRLRGISSSVAYTSITTRAKREIEYLKSAKYVIGRTHFDHCIPQLFNSDVKLFQGEELLRPEFYQHRWDKTEFCPPLRIVTTISNGIYKGYETALATAKALTQYSNIDFEWVIIGYTADNEWVKKAETYIGCQSKKVNIKFKGKLDAKDIVKTLLESDLYVQVSHIENSPNSVCEAMILGMPIIASFAGGTSSMIQDGTEGILIQDGDPYVLAGTIISLSKEHLKAIEMGRKARERALKRHNPDEVCNRLTRIYSNIIEMDKNSSLI